VLLKLGVRNILAYAGQCCGSFRPRPWRDYLAPSVTYDPGRESHDVLNVLYESVIGAETRKCLRGTTRRTGSLIRSWAKAVADSLEQRILHPACGSGTFLFHAVREHVGAADETGVPLATASRLLVKVPADCLRPRRSRYLAMYPGLWAECGRTCRHTLAFLESAWHQN